MKKMKPFGGKTRRYSEGGSTEEPDETGTYTSGVRMGRNANIGDDTRARAMAMLDRNEAKSTLKSLADERPAPKAAPKAAAKPAAAKPATDMERRGAGAETKGGNDEPSARAEARKAGIPMDDEPASPSTSTRGSRFLEGLKDNAGKALAATGAAAGVGAAYKIGKTLAARQGAKQADSIMAAATKRAAENRERKQGLSEMRERAQEAAKSRERAPLVRRAPKDMDEARMADEGGPNFRKGGSVRGCGVARRGLTKGTMR